MKKNYFAKSGHTLFIEPVKFNDLPDNVKKFDCIVGCKRYYLVKNWDAEGVVFFYIGLKQGQWLVWYRGGGFWSSYGKTLELAIDGAQEDGWLYA